MRSAKLLLRQIHPNFVDCGRITSQAFIPTRKDEDRLSVDDGDKISPEMAFANYTRSGEVQSAGVAAVSVGECVSVKLRVSEDPLEDSPSHMLIDFRGLSKKAKVTSGKQLRDFSEIRGWQYRQMK